MIGIKELARAIERAFGTCISREADMNTAYEALFGSTANVGWAQECARALVIFLYGLVLVRIAGAAAGEA